MQRVVRLRHVAQFVVHWRHVSLDSSVVVYPAEHLRSHLFEFSTAPTAHSVQKSIVVWHLLTSRTSGDVQVAQFVIVSLHVLQLESQLTQISPFRIVPSGHVERQLPS
jgi:hypothetical protein